MRSQLQRVAVPDGGAGVHHIESVAHHFLSQPQIPQSPAAVAVCRDVAVAAPGSGRAAACAAAGLAVATAARAGWGSCVVEDETIPWSASTYLGGAGSTRESLPASVARDLPPGARTLALTGDGATDAGWLRWRLLGEVSLASLPEWERASALPVAAQAAPPRWRALVWCVVAHEAAAADAVRCLQRLVALLRPERLELLVVPDAWEQRPGARRPLLRHPGPAWRNAAHLQEIARVVAAGIPAGVRVFPESAGSGGRPGLALLEDVAGVLVAG